MNVRIVLYQAFFSESIMTFVIPEEPTNSLLNTRQRKPTRIVLSAKHNIVYRD